MRFQKKRLQPTYHLAERHLKPPANAHEAETRWQSFKYKAPLSDKLFDEQYGLCAYTELRLDEDESGDHIEHVKPKSSFPKNTFDYQNLVLCALSSDALKTMHLFSRSTALRCYAFGVALRPFLPQSGRITLHRRAV